MKHDGPGIDDDLTHVALLNAIKSDEVRAAYLYFIRMAEQLEGFKCFPYVTGSTKRVFSYNTTTGRPFELIVTQFHLLFYLRNASKGYAARSISLLKERFGDAAVDLNDKGEITVRITSLRSAQQLHRLLFHQEQASE